MEAEAVSEMEAVANVIQTLQLETDATSELEALATVIKSTPLEMQSDSDMEYNVLRARAVVFEEPAESDMIANASYIVAVYLNAESESELEGYANGIVNAIIDIESVSEMEPVATKITSFGELELIARSDYEFNNDSETFLIFRYTGVLQAGEQIVIDTDKFSVTKDGQNALNDYQGEFVDIFPDINVVAYNDSETQRQVNVRVDKCDRWV